jgi:beta-1,4-glucosyltransferase
MREPITDPAVERFVASLIAVEHDRARGRGAVRVSWLNHYSIGAAFVRDGLAVRELDVCGVDGLLLKLVLRHPARTSADLVVPLLLQRDPRIRRILAVGGHGDRSLALEAALRSLAGRPVSVHAVDGFDGLPRGAEMRSLVARVAPDLVLIGLGAGLQERVASEAAEGMTRGYALTCGGFLDQVLQPRYYPPWAYPLRLNWLVRLVREPRRLWRRYSVDAFRVVVQWRSWRRAALTVPGIAVHAQMCSAEGAPRTAD